MDVSWLELCLGTDDLPDAFRGVPLHEADQRAAIIAVYDPQARGWRFVQMHGCPFGLGSVVLTFNRYPALVTAALRRTLCLMAGSYFDDNLLVDIEVAASHAKQLLQDFFAGLGTPPKAPRPFRWRRIGPFWGQLWRCLSSPSPA